MLKVLNCGVCAQLNCCDATLVFTKFFLSGVRREMFKYWCCCGTLQQHCMCWNVLCSEEVTPCYLEAILPCLFYSTKHDPSPVHSYLPAYRVLHFPRAEPTFSPGRAQLGTWVLWKGSSLLCLLVVYMPFCCVDAQSRSCSVHLYITKVLCLWWITC